MPDYSAWDPAPFAFVLIPLLLVGALVWGTAVAWRRLGASRGQTARAAAWVLAGSGAWMAASWAAAASGILRQWHRVPPPLGLLVLSIAALAIAIAFSRLGTRLAQQIPLAALVAVQGFRLPLELAMHDMYERGIMPVQMSYSGLNFDIATGASALAVAALVAARRAGPALVTAWNVVGLALLVNVVTVAILATPLFQYFGPDHVNTWVTYPPFVWLPAVSVLAALAGHLVIFRALAHARTERAPGPEPAARSSGHATK